MTSPALARRGCLLRCAQPCPTGEPCWLRGCDDIIHLIEAKSERDHQRVRAVVLEHGGPEVLARHDANMRDLRLGLTTARSAWHSLTERQRVALEALVASPFRRLRDGGYATERQDIPLAAHRFRATTVRALASHDLGDWDGGALDPEARVVASDRGRFVLRHGAGDPA